MNFWDFLGTVLSGPEIRLVGAMLVPAVTILAAAVTIFAGFAGALFVGSALHDRGLGWLNWLAIPTIIAATFVGVIFWYWLGNVA